MNLFILGIILGAGIVLAYQEIKRQIRAFKQAKLDADIKRTIAMLNECTCWTTTVEHAYYCQTQETP